MLSSDKLLELKENIPILSTPDVTSIVNVLENVGVSGIPELLPNDFNHFEYIGENLNTMSYWLDRNLYPTVLTLDYNEMKETFNRLLSFKTRLNVVLKCMNAQFYKIKRVGGNCSDKDIDSVATFVPSPVNNHDESEDFYDLEQNFDNMSLENKSVSSNDKSKKKNKKKKFIYTHSADVLNKVYPQYLMRDIAKLQNKNPLHTIQVVRPQLYYCLICQREINKEKNLFLHVDSKMHRTAISKRTTVDSCLFYHAFFGSMPYKLQIHQVFFYPFIQTFVVCKLCSTILSFEDVETHIVDEKFKIELKRSKCYDYYYFKEIENAFKTKVEKSVDKKDSHTSLTCYHKNYPNENIHENAERRETTFFKELSEVLQENEKKKLNQAIPSKSIEIKPPNFHKLNLNDLQKTEEATSSDESVIIKFEEVQKISKEKNSTTTNSEIETSESNCSDETKTKSRKNKVLNKKSILEPLIKQQISHNVVPSFNPKAKKLLDKLEHRFNKHKNYIQNKKGFSYCSICCVQIPTLVKQIKMHIISKGHMEYIPNSQSPTKYTFFCNLCATNFKSELQWEQHMQNPHHLQKKETVKHQYDMTEYECLTCNKILYGTKDFASQHHKMVLKTKKKKKVINLKPQMEALLRSKLMLDAEIDKLKTESDDVLDSMIIVMDCCKAFQNALKFVFPKCKAYPFGSRVSGLGNLSSDLDIFLDIGGMFNGNNMQLSEDQVDIVKKVASVLKKNSNFMDIFTIPLARTPIVQVFHVPTCLDCDLSFRHGLSVGNTEYLKFCIQIQPNLKMLILFLKKWSICNCIKAKISTYALSMLTIFYMQVRTYLPSVAQIRLIDPTPPRIIAGWESFVYVKPISAVREHFPQCNVSIKNLLKDIFNFYSNFKFETQIVCPLLGHSVNKKDFNVNSGCDLPHEMKIYVDRIKTDNNSEIFRSLSPMCIQDPFDLSHNLTKACPEIVVHKFVKLCKLSYKVLCEQK